MPNHFYYVSLIDTIIDFLHWCGNSPLFKTGSQHIIVLPHDCNNSAGISLISGYLELFNFP
jgi:hypothetical protein